GQMFVAKKISMGIRAPQVIFPEANFSHGAHAADPRSAQKSAVRYEPPYRAEPDHYAYMARQVTCALIIDSLCRAPLRSNMAQGCNLRFCPGLQTFHPYRVISNLISQTYTILRA